MRPALEGAVNSKAIDWSLLESEEKQSVALRWGGHLLRVYYAPPA